MADSETPVLDLLTRMTEDSVATLVQAFAVELETALLAE